MFGVHGGYYFNKSIGNLYGYFTLIGVNGKLPEYHVTPGLELVPKPTFIDKIIERVLGAIFICFSKTSQLSSAISNIESYLKDHSNEIKKQTIEKARFVINVLKIIESKKDRGLAKLSEINQIRSLLPHAIIEDKNLYVELFQRVERQYFNNETLDEVPPLSQAVIALTNAPKDTRWNNLPTDILYLICRKLNPYDVVNVMRTCPSWKIAASAKGVWDTFKSDDSYRSYFPVLPSVMPSDNLWDAFKSHQLLCRSIQASACKTNESPVLIASGTRNDFIGKTYLLANEHLCVVSGTRSEMLIMQKDEVRTFPNPFYQINYRTDTILVDDEVYFLIYRSLGGPGGQGPLFITNFNDETGEVPYLFHEPDRRFRGFYHCEKKGYFIWDDGSISVVDFKTKQVVPRSYRVSVDHLYSGGVFCHNYIYINREQEIVTQNLSDPDSLPHVIPNSANYGRILEGTSTTLFIIKDDGRSIIALDIESGKVIGDYYLKSRSNENLNFDHLLGKPMPGGMEITPHFIESTMAIIDEPKKIKGRFAHIAKNLLFVGCKKVIYVFDIVSKNHLTSLRPFNSLGEFAIHDNKLVYEEDTEDDANGFITAIHGNNTNGFYDDLATYVINNYVKIYSREIL